MRYISGEPGTPKYRPTSCPQVASGGVCARCLVNVSDLLKGVREPILGTRYCARMVRGVPVESLEYTEDVTGCQGEGRTVCVRILPAARNAEGVGGDAKQER